MTMTLDGGFKYLVDGIEKLTAAILEGNQYPFSSEEYIKLYDTVYILCTEYDSYEQLYNTYTRTVDGFINSMVLPSLRGKHDESLLRELLIQWGKHKVFLRWLSRFFNYLEHVNGFLFWGSLCSLKEVGYSRFHESVYEEFHGSTTDACIALINQERENKRIDQELLNNTLGIYSEVVMGRVDWFMKDFVTRMLDASADFYSNKASNWILEDSCPDYMLKAEECLKQENKTFSNYLPAVYRNKLIERVHSELLVKHGSELLKKEASGFCALLHNDQVDDLSRMFRLFSQSPESLDCVESMFKEHVRAEIKPLVQQAEDAGSNKEENAGGPQELLFCRKMVELHEKIMNYVTLCFNNHMHFQKVLKDAVRNTTMSGCSCAELLASYCDNILKKGSSQKLSDESIEQTLDEMVRLLAYVNHEDRFSDFYWRKLSRRLVFEKSRSLYNEMWFLKKLKTIIGWQYILKMEQMVTDTANETCSFSKSPSNRGVDFKVNVLTPHSWPRYKTSNLTLPSEMATCVDIFEEFYKRNATPKNLASSDLSLGSEMVFNQKRENTGRELMWIYSLGKCKLNCTFEEKTIMLILGNYQAAALLLFNAADSLSFTDIKTKLNLDVEDVTRVLHSLSCAKYQILTKVPDTKEISQDDCFEFNYKFTDRRRRIKIPLPRLSSLVFERKEVQENRDHVIDASIVRIMKARKVLNFEQQVSECRAELCHLFKPTLNAMKKRIDALITLGYMERVEGDKFQYVS